MEAPEAGGRSPSLFPELSGEAPSLYTTGLLPSQRIQEFIQAGHITAAEPIAPDQVQPASLDLRLGPIAFRVRASFLPGPASPVLKKAEEFMTHEVDLSRPAVLERGCVYIVPLLEELRLPAGVSAKANPKSTVGRLDVFTRLITDHGPEFERVRPGYRGRLYLEIVPRTFAVLVQAGMRLNQVRFMRGKPPPSDTMLADLHEEQVLLYVEDGAVVQPTIAKGLWIHVDLEGVDGREIVGYKAKAHAPLIDFSKLDYYEPLEFWDPIPRSSDRRIILNPGDFYVLASKERVSVPPEVAAEMVGYDPSVGEFRIHYAGFFDPGFGYGPEDVRGTHAVLEVRSHEVPFVLEDGQQVGRLIFERLIAPPDKLYGPGIGSNYQRQGLSLSKQFKRGNTRTED
jgi:dCTP deaminase